MSSPDLVCLSHLRWNFAYQRPNHLMARAARDRRVFFIEEPIHSSSRSEPEIELTAQGVTVVRPVLPEIDDETKLPPLFNRRLLRKQVTDLFRAYRIRDPWLWYYSPLATRWTSHLPHSAVVYDCMDELSAFRHAAADLPLVERRLVARADAVFAGGRRLYEAKKRLHPQTHLFPSSVDCEHFSRARCSQPDPEDQALISGPRVGYFGVIDERLDLELLAQVADARPAWQLVMLGPIAKLEESDLPRRPNLHWLGPKPYEQLPAYLAGWDVAMMPFALNESTRHISPTKTPEYLAGGRPVVSTPIADVVEPYGRLGLVEIALGADQFVGAIESALRSDRTALMATADRLLSDQSWDRTWARMDAIVAARAATDAPRELRAREIRPREVPPREIVTVRAA